MDKVFPERQMDWSRRERVEMEGKKCFSHTMVYCNCNWMQLYIMKMKKRLPSNSAMTSSQASQPRCCFSHDKFFQPQPRLLRWQDWVPVQRWSHFALAYCRRVPQLCASSIKPRVSVGLPTSFSKVKAFVWLYYLHDSISGNRSTRRKTTDSHEKFWSLLGKRCLGLVWIVNGGTYWLEDTD